MRRAFLVQIFGIGYCREVGNIRCMTLSSQVIHIELYDVNKQRVAYLGQLRALIIGSVVPSKTFLQHLLLCIESKLDTIIK